MLPQSWVQVLVIGLAVIPGFVYQISLRSLRGPAPDELDVTIRILRAIATSLVFAAAYVVVAGQRLTGIFLSPSTAQYSPRSVALLAIALVLVFPWLVARVKFYISTSAPWLRLSSLLIDKFGLRRPYDPTPAAWDFAFTDRELGWVRVLTTDGRWIGGWFGEDSFATSFPNPREIFLERSYEMADDGSFAGDVAAASGVYIRCDDIRLIEFIPDEPPDGPARWPDDTVGRSSLAGWLLALGLAILRGKRHSVR